jgi:hypothetical protein
MIALKDISMPHVIYDRGLELKLMVFIVRQGIVEHGLLYVAAIACRWYMRG